MEVDWDLQAVVRGCTTSSTPTAATTASSFAVDFNYPQSCFSSVGSGGQATQLFSLPDPFEARNAIGELHELFTPFLPKSLPVSSSLSPSISSLPCFSMTKDQTQIKQLQQQLQSKPSHAGSAHSSTAANSHTPRSKRRKNQLKKVCHVPAEALSSDVWAWRKYGQKPIKGSPYPRGYYRCSSSKGCLARKQVERNRSDPGMFIVTYTAEHNHPAPTHRNSLAGSTRQKPAVTPQTITTSDSNKPSTSTPTKPLCSSSPATSLEDERLPHGTNAESRDEKDAVDMLEDDEEDEHGFSDVAVSDDFFAGLEELSGLANGDRFSDHLPASFGLPWIANNAATAAGGI